MSPRTPKLLRTVTFAESPGGIWGAVCDSDGTFVAAGDGEAALVVPGSDAELRGASPSEGWDLSGPGIELRVEPVGDAVAAETPEGWHQLCRVHGRIAAADAERDIDLPGRRCVLPGVDIGDLDSVRDVSAYFAPADGIALTALRPRRRRGHDRDVVLAAVLEDGGGQIVEDPRLSTTYARGGEPWRVGVELWLSGEDEATEYPVRAAGEADGAGARETIGGVEHYAGPVRWHSRGRLGGGVYLLLRGR